MISVIIADDHPPLREGIKRRLEEQPDIRVIGEAGTGPELFAMLSREPLSDVLVLDIRMPDFEAVPAIPGIRTLCPKMGILIVSAHDDPTHINQMMEAEVDGYVVKQEDMSIYATAIREIAAGRTYFSQRVFGVALDNHDAMTPSARELEVLTLVAKDATTDDIAKRLGISPRTVETYVKRICEKLGARTRAGAVGKAVQLGYISVLD